MSTSVTPRVHTPAKPSRVPPQPAEPRARVPARVWRVTAVVVVGAFMTQLDGALVNIGLASVAADLHASLQATQWIVSGYLLALVIGLPLCGWASRRVGAGRLWLGALGAFTVASALCALSVNIELLVASRAVQGLAGGLLLPAGQTVIAQVAGRNLMGRVMSTAGMALVLGPAAGPIVGGFLIAHASWPWLFLVNLPVGALGWWLGRRIIPRGEAGGATGFDAVGFALVGVALPALVYAISEAGQHRPVWSVPVGAPLVLGCACLAAFGWRCLRVRAPLLNVRLLGGGVFAAAAASSFFAGVIQFGALVIWALYFQLVRGYGLVASGLAMVGFAVGAATLPVSGRLTDRFGGGPVCLAGAILSAATFIPVALLPGDTTLFAVEALLLVLGIGNAMSVVPASTAAYIRVRKLELADAVTQINILLRLGGAVGAALLIGVLGDRPGRGLSAVPRFHAAFWCLTAISLAAIVAALLLVRACAARQTRHDQDGAGGPNQAGQPRAADTQAAQIQVTRTQTTGTQATQNQPARTRRSRP